MPGTVSSTSPARITGRASSCAAVTAPWLAADAMPDEILGRVLDVGDVSERAASGHDHVGVQRRASGRRPRYRDARLPTHDPCAQHAEIEQAKCELGAAGRHVVELIRAGLVGHGRQLARSLTTRSIATPGSDRHRSDRGRGRRHGLSSARAAAEPTREAPRRRNVVILSSIACGSVQREGDESRWTAGQRRCGMLSHGCQSCAGRRASRCGRCSAAVWLLPHLDLSVTGDRAARIGCGNLPHRRSRSLRHIAVDAVHVRLLGFAWLSEAALLTGLLDITGGRSTRSS